MAELRCRRTVSVEQSSGCSTATGDVSAGVIAHFQATTQGLSVTHLIYRRTEGTSTTARCYCGVFRDSGAGYINYRFTYLLTYVSCIIYLPILPGRSSLPSTVKCMEDLPT